MYLLWLALYVHIYYSDGLSNAQQNFYKNTTFAESLFLYLFLFSTFIFICVLTAFFLSRNQVYIFFYHSRHMCTQKPFCMYLNLPVWYLCWEAKCENKNQYIQIVHYFGVFSVSIAFHMNVNIHAIFSIARCQRTCCREYYQLQFKLTGDSYHLQFTLLCIWFAHSLSPRTC